MSRVDVQQNGTPCSETECCPHLQERLVHTGVGLHAIHTVKLAAKVGEVGDSMRLLGVVYKRNQKDRGLLLNWCPFCGGKPGYFERDPVSAEVRHG